MWWTQTTAPDGWLICDGSQISRTTYSDLFSVIGTTFGSGDGSTTFTLPDLRAAFVRGAGSKSGYVAEFGEIQNPTSIQWYETAGSYGSTIESVQNADTSTGDSPSQTWCSTRARNQRRYISTIRPYNIALTPVIKY